MAVKGTRGFTLLEIMIVVAIVGILAAIVLPAYQGQVRKANRSAAQQFMQDVAAREHQIFLDLRRYGNVAATADFPNAPTASSNPGVNMAVPTATTGKYTFKVVADNTATPPTFIVSATATGSQAADGDLGDLTLTQAGVKGPAGKW